jgi:Flp pilus assembly protein CpaB
VRLRHRPWLFWFVAVSLAAVTGLTVASLVGEAASRARRLGGLREVPVVARAVAAGQRLSPADVAVRRLPAAMLPEGPVARSPADHAAVVPLVPGEVLLEAKLAPWGVQGVAALVPPGRRALAVPTAKGGLSLRTGHRVDVLATFETTEGGSEPTFPVATAALVVDVGEEAVTVAVLPEEAPRVAFATARGSVTLAVTPPQPSTSH